MTMLDLVLAGGRVVDGSGAPAFDADVGLAGDRIAAIGAGLVGRERLDCTSYTITPGFIDTHGHSEIKLLADPTLPMKIRQGVTLEVLGQDGISVAPVKHDDRDAWRRTLVGLLGDFGVAWDWSTTAEYLARVATARPAVDVAYLAPHGALRRIVMGADDRRATSAELAAMQSLLETALAEGACGLSTGLIYAPCSYAGTDELIALGRVIAKAGRPLAVHMRSESDRLLEAVDEMVRVAAESGCAVHISHLKIAGRQNFDRVDALVARLEAARARGLRVTADQYPYVAGSTLLGAILPPWAHAGGVDAAVGRLRDAPARARLRRELLDPAPVDWDNVWKWGGPEAIVISDVPSGRRATWLGRTLADVAAEERRDALELAFDLLVDERLAVAMVCFSQSEDVVERLLALPFASVCTDGLLGGRPHPRAYGTYPRILGRYVRERGVLSFEEAVRKMTSQAAAAFGFGDVGLVRAGLRANLVVLDPASVADRATFAEPAQFPVGIRDVLVGGAFVVRDGATTGARPGKVVQ